jgi:hypothetical protein
VFPRRDFQIDPTLAFVAMPFAADFNPLYEAIESLLVEHCNLRCLRADTVPGNGSITADIWRYVNEAMVVIADLSGEMQTYSTRLGSHTHLASP